MALTFWNVNINAKAWLGRTALHVTVVDWHGSVVKALLHHKEIKLHMLDWWRRTPLLWAAEQGRVDIVKMLLDTGKCQGSIDRSGWTPLSLAKANGHDEVVSLLEEYAI